jgi:small subunit ribosomal protein S20
MSTSRPSRWLFLLALIYLPKPAIFFWLISSRVACLSELIVNLTLQMPRTKSALKAMRQNIKRRAANLVTLEKIRKAEKAVRKNVAAGKLDDAKVALQAVYATLDKAAKKGVIHKNNASRNKSRLSKFLSKAPAK